MKKHQRGEIVTLITLGTFLVIGVISLVSSAFLKKPQTTKTSAQTIPANACTKCDGPGGTCAYHPELDKRVNDNNPGCNDNGCTADGSNGIQCDADKKAGTKPGTPVPVPACDLKNNFKTLAECEAKDKCGPGNCSQVNYAGGFVPDCYQCANKSQFGGCTSGKFNLTGSCDPACCSTDSDCSMNGDNQVCGVGNTYCKSGYSCAGLAPGETKPKYVRICGGASNGTCGWTFCTGKNIDPKTGNSIPLSSCVDDQSSGGGQMCKSDDDCTPPPNGCFHLTDEVTLNSDGKTFTHWVKFKSDGGDGHITLSRNGANTGLQQTGWNMNYNPNDPQNLEPHTFVVPPDYTGGNLPQGTQTYTGTADHCKQGIGSASVSCTTGINPDGTAFIRGAGCIAKNFTNVPPKPLPTPTPKTSSNNVPVPNFQPQAQYSNQLAGVCAGAGAPSVWKCSDGKFYTSGCPQPTDHTTIGFTTYNDACATWTKANPAAAAATVPTTSSTAQNNRCPTGTDVTCAFGSCGSGYTTINTPCINFWDVCCVKSNTSIPAVQTLLTPTSAQTVQSTSTFELDAGGINQFFNAGAVGSNVGDTSNMQICDYFGSTNFGANDVRNCINAKVTDRNGNKVTISYPTKPNQKQLLCNMELGIPIQCFPIN